MSTWTLIVVQFVQRADIPKLDCLEPTKTPNLPGVLRHPPTRAERSEVRSCPLQMRQGGFPLPGSPLACQGPLRQQTPCRSQARRVPRLRKNTRHESWPFGLITHMGVAQKQRDWVTQAFVFSYIYQGVVLVHLFEPHTHTHNHESVCRVWGGLSLDRPRISPAKGIIAGLIRDIAPLPIAHSPLSGP